MPSRESDRRFANTVKVISVTVVVGVFGSILISPMLYIVAGLVGGLVLLALYQLNTHRHLSRVRSDLQRGWLACANCGYDLRGQMKPAEGRPIWNDIDSLRKSLNEPSDPVTCPECGRRSTTDATRKYWYHNTLPQRR